MLSPILAIFARISKPLWLNIRFIGAEVTGRDIRLFRAMDAALSATSTQLFCLNFTLHGQDRDRDSRVPRPRPRPRLVKTGLKTKTRVSRTPSLPDCHSALAHQISSEPNHTRHSYDVISIFPDGSHRTENLLQQSCKTVKIICILNFDISIHRLK